MSLWRRRQDYIDTLKREMRFFLAPIAATGAMILAVVLRLIRRALRFPMSRCRYGGSNPSLAIEFIAGHARLIGSPRPRGHHRAAPHQYIRTHPPGLS